MGSLIEQTPCGHLLCAGWSPRSCRGTGSQGLRVSRVLGAGTSPETGGSSSLCSTFQGVWPLLRAAKASLEPRSRKEDGAAPWVGGRDGYKAESLLTGFLGWESVPLMELGAGAPAWLHSMAKTSPRRGGEIRFPVAVQGERCPQPRTGPPAGAAAPPAVAPTVAGNRTGLFPYSSGGRGPCPWLGTVRGGAGLRPSEARGQSVPWSFLLLEESASLGSWPHHSNPCCTITPAPASRRKNLVTPLGRPESETDPPSPDRSVHCTAGPRRRQCVLALWALAGGRLWGVFGGPATTLFSCQPPPGPTHLFPLWPLCCLDPSSLGSKPPPPTPTLLLLLLCPRHWRPPHVSSLG